jgi:hypothetical protein
MVTRCRFAVARSSWNQAASSFRLRRRCSGAAKSGKNVLAMACEEIGKESLPRQVLLEEASLKRVFDAYGVL